jgi:dTDP-4-dehydrorhamnose reductase
MSKKIIITGANGLVGQKLVHRFAEGGFEILATDLQEQPFFSSFDNVEYTRADITAYSSLKELIGSYNPDIIINSAAFTNVDGCETEKELSRNVNVNGPEYLAELAKRADAKFIHISSDYIFNGESGPYREEDRPDPISEYGRQKLESEKAVSGTGGRYLIFRGIVIFGYAPGVNINYATWLMRELGAGRPVRIVTDQWGNTLMAEDMAEIIYLSVRKDAEGVFHAGNEHFHSRYDFAVEIAEFFNYSVELINAILTKDLNQKARRPLKSGLRIDKAKDLLGFSPMPLAESFKMLKEQVTNG